MQTKFQPSYELALIMILAIISGSWLLARSLFQSKKLQNPALPVTRPHNEEIEFPKITSMDLTKLITAVEAHLTEINGISLGAADIPNYIQYKENFIENYKKLVANKTSVVTYLSIKKVWEILHNLQKNLDDFRTLILPIRKPGIFGNTTTQSPYMLSSAYVITEHKITEHIINDFHIMYFPIDAFMSITKLLSEYNHLMQKYVDINELESDYKIIINYIIHAQPQITCAQCAVSIIHLQHILMLGTDLTEDQQFNHLSQTILPTLLVILSIHLHKEKPIAEIAYPTVNALIESINTIYTENDTLINSKNIKQYVHTALKININLLKQKLQQNNIPEVIHTLEYIKKLHSICEFHSEKININFDKLQSISSDIDNIAQGFKISMGMMVYR